MTWSFNILIPRHFRRRQKNNSASQCRSAGTNWLSSPAAMPVFAREWRAGMAGRAGNAGGAGRD
ncbi:MAG: hypothetical protein ACR2P5_08100 [Gammaproteobacteria bacterium]